MKKLASLFLSMVMLLSIATGCSNTTPHEEVVTPTQEPQVQEQPKELTKITVSEVTHSIFYAAQYIAINEGFFAEEGLEVELINGGGADKVMTSVLTGAADIGLAGAEASIYVYNQGKEAYPKVFAQLTACDGSFLIGREENTDFDWNSLKGKTILPGRKGGMPYMTLLYCLNQNGLEVGEDVFFNDTMQFDAMTGAFISGEGDFVTAFEPVATSLETEGKGHVVASVGQEGGKVPYTVYFATQDMDKDILAKFTRAIQKGQDFLNEKSLDEIANAVAPSFADTDLQVIKDVVERYKSIDAFSYTPEMSVEDFDRIIEIVKNAGELDKEARIPFADLIDNNYCN